jgi:type VI secretion system protein ImpH
MACNDRREAASMSTEQFFDDITKHSLFEALHLLEFEVLRREAQIGTDALPKHESMNLKVNSKLGYENNQVCDVRYGASDRLEIKTNLIGLIGEQGVLPQHYSELALARLRESDSAMVDFYDIFNHRLLSLYYRSWQLSQVTVQVRAHSRMERSPYADCLDSISSDNSQLAQHFGGYHSSPIKSKSALKSIVESLANCSAKIHEFKGQWLHLDSKEQTRLTSNLNPEGQFSQLGNGASIGKRAWDINASAIIELLPTGHNQVKELLPFHTRLRAVKCAASALIGSHKQIQWKLTTKHSMLPKSCLSKRQGQLGFGTVLKKHDRTEDREITINI